MGTLGCAAGATGNWSPAFPPSVALTPEAPFHLAYLQNLRALKMKKQVGFFS